MNPEPHRPAEVLPKNRQTTKGGSLPASGLSAPADESEDGRWSKIVTAEQRLLDFRWREVWAYRDLIFLFVQRDFIATYKQTILGPLWFMLQPLFTNSPAR